MSRFFLTEVRRDRRHRWKEWMISDLMAASVASAKRMARGTMPDARHARAICIDTDAGTVTVCWEGRR